MGVQTTIILYAQDHETALSAAAAAFDRINRLDAVMSDYRRDSELSRLSDAAGGPPTPISPDLFDILDLSLRLSSLSGGAFDPTIGPATQSWRAARRSGLLPSDDEQARIRSLVDWRRLSLDPAARAARLETPGMRLDLGGIGKGYAAQEAADTLRSLGFSRCLVSLAGDVVAGDPPPGAPGWVVAIDGEQSSGSPRRSVLLANAAISTSGDTAQFVEIGGRRYAHICDPRTGLGIPDRRSVTILAPSGQLADGLATAACILGPENSIPLLNSFAPVAAIFEESTDAGPVTTTHDPRRLLRPAP